MPIEYESVIQVVIDILIGWGHEKNNERKRSDATPSFDFASLAKGLAAPVVTSDQGDAVNTKQPGSGGKKR